MTRNTSPQNRFITSSPLGQYLAPNTMTRLTEILHFSSFTLSVEVEVEVMESWFVCVKIGFYFLGNIKVMRFLKTNLWLSNLTVSPRGDMFHPSITHWVFLGYYVRPFNVIIITHCCEVAITAWLGLLCRRDFYDNHNL